MWLLSSKKHTNWLGHYFYGIMLLLDEFTECLLNVNKQNRVLARTAAQVVYTYELYVLCWDDIISFDFASCR